MFHKLEKTFDRAKWKKMVEILNEKKVECNNKRLIQELYMKHIATTKVNKIMTV